LSAGGFAVTFGIGGAALPAAASFGASHLPPATIAAMHDSAVATIALSGLFGATLVAAGAWLDQVAGPGHRGFLAFSAAAFAGEMAAPAGLLTVSGPVNPYNGSVTLAAAVLFLVWAAVFAIRMRPRG
jgi:hypothetical protein